MLGSCHRAALAVALVGLVAASAAAAAPPPDDTTPPETAIDSGPESTTTSTSATFTFSANEANSTFECSLDGGRFAKCSSPKSYSGLALGQHTFAVRATDKARNEDPTPATWAWSVVTGPPDTTPPETTINSATTTNNRATFAFSSSEAGSTFQCALDGSAFAACTSPRTYDQLADGSHTFQVRATDAAGNTDLTPATHTWTIGSGSPPTQVSCGQVLTRSVRVANDLTDCVGDGLVAGSGNITIDLDGHTIDGSGSGAGVRVEGLASVTVRNGTVREFGEGVFLGLGTRTAVVERVTADANQNGIVLEGATGNAVLSNTVTASSDAGIDVSLAADDNRLEANVVTASGDAGIAVSDSNGNRVLSNTSHENSDSGIGLSTATGGEVSGNDVRFNPSGIELQGATGVRLASNNASNATGIGIELAGGSLDNDLLSNIVLANAGHGIFVADEALEAPGNLIDGNTASGNSGDGIHVAKGGHSIRGNTADDNGGWGIFAAEGNSDGGGNDASGNGQAEQCFGVTCR